MNRNPPPSAEAQFFSESNEQNLYTTLAQDFQQRMNTRLSTEQANRLGKALEHYMQQVWDVNGPMPISTLNREVLGVVAKDFSGYLRRNQVAPSVAVSEQILSDPANQPRQETGPRLLLQQGNTAPSPLPMSQRPTFENTLLMDTGGRFEQLQKERTAPSAPPAPPVPDFQVGLAVAADEPSALSLYEKAKAAREKEIQNMVAAAAPPSSSIVVGQAATDANPLLRFISPPSIRDDAVANPTLAEPIAPIVLPPRGPLPQDFLIKQDDIINYKETEYNLVLYSADRDWYNNTKENRYNFSILFDPGNNKHGFTINAATNKKFKNISRIELVKAILPSEGLENLVAVSSKAPVVYNTGSKVNVLQYPYILVRIPELDTNNYGTDNHIDNAFGILQYDANWYTDTTNLSDGYLGMIPKFMKCQKVYQPTPLATLTNLSIELQRPDGSLLSCIPDTLVIQNIYASNFLPPGYGYGGVYAGATKPNGAPYYLVQTATYFNQWLFQKGNRIQIKGLNPTNITGGLSQAGTDFTQYLTRDEGHLIVGIGNTSVSNPDGPNEVGYANLLILEAPLLSPESGSTDVLPFGGSAVTNTNLADNLMTTAFSGARLINLTHQTSLVLRIITRDLDAAPRVRPDNL